MTNDQLTELRALCEETIGATHPLGIVGTPTVRQSREFRIARALLSRLEREKDHVMVPREPTEEMMAAAISLGTLEKWRDNFRTGDQYRIAMYKAMLSAAEATNDRG